MGAQWDNELEYDFVRLFKCSETDTDEKSLLLKYTQWLNRRGFFVEDLQCDFEHQIETFLNDFNNDADD